MTEPQSQLARHVPRPSTSDVALKAMGARAWWDSGVLVVRLSTVRSPSIRLMMKAVAAHVFGGRADG